MEEITETFISTAFTGKLRMAVREIEVSFKQLSADAVMPQKATSGSAAYDVYAPQNIRITPGRNLIPLDFAIQLPDGFEAKIEPRSGFSLNGFEGYGMNPDLATCKLKSHRYDADVIQGKIDSDYTGNCGVIVLNRDRTFFVKKGTRIAQLTIYRVNNADFILTDNLETTERKGGFGHTGVD